MAAELPLSDLNARLLRELAQAAIAADRSQLNNYVALAAEAGSTLDEVRKRAAGATPEEEMTIARRYIANVLKLDDGRGPAIGPRGDLLPPELIGLDAQRRQRLLEVFPDAEREIERTDIPKVPWAIRRDAVARRVTEKLQREAEARWRDASALLRTGMPKTRMHRGTIAAKVVLRTLPDGEVVAQLASAETVRESGEAVVSTLTGDFTVDAFPPFES